MCKNCINTLNVKHWSLQMLEMFAYATLILTVSVMCTV